LCSVHAIIQVLSDGVVDRSNCRCHSFAACTVDVTVCFILQTVRAVLSPRASRAILHSQRPADSLVAYCLFWSENWLLAYFLPPPSPIVCFASMGFQTFSQNNPSCILSQHEVRYPCTVERLVDTSPFLLLLDTSLFETNLIHPRTML